MRELTLYKEAVTAIKEAILHSRYIAARLANAEQLQLYYRIGRYVSENTRQGKWGTGAIETISQQLQSELPGVRGFSAGNMKKMRLFYEAWPDVLNRSLTANDIKAIGEETLKLVNPDKVTLNRSMPSNDLTPEEATVFERIGFSHHFAILTACKSKEERWYYINRCATEFWSVESLNVHLKAKDFKHFGKLTNNFLLAFPDEKSAKRAIRAFKDEYLLDFVNIEDSENSADIDERVLESAIVSEIKKFIMSFGAAFCFIGNQYRLLVADDEYFIDLLFFNRDLQCLVAVELKRGKFKPSYLGQLNFYLSALDEQVKKPNENQSIGIILCRQAKRTVVELAVRDFSKPMGVAVYRTASKVPKPYQSLVTVMDGVRQILLSDGQQEEEQK